MRIAEPLPTQTRLVRFRLSHAHLRDRLDALYVDTLDGRVDAAFFDQKASEGARN
jgi:hypothetical protein